MTNLKDLDVVAMDREFDKIKRLSDTGVITFREAYHLREEVRQNLRAVIGLKENGASE